MKAQANEAFSTVDVDISVNSQLVVVNQVLMRTEHLMQDQQAVTGSRNLDGCIALRPHFVRLQGSLRAVEWRSPGSHLHCLGHEPPHQHNVSKLGSHKQITGLVPLRHAVKRWGS